MNRRNLSATKHKGRLVLLALVAGCSASTGQREDSRGATVAPVEEEEAMAEGLIRQRVDDYAKAISAKDIDSVMSFFARDVVSFDIAISSLRYAGADNKRREWQKVFAAYGSIDYEVHDLKVAAQGELAFVHAVNHVRGTRAGGEVTDLWVRWTACFRRIDGSWLIVHDHVSVPADFERGQALVNLKP